MKKVRLRKKVLIPLITLAILGIVIFISVILLNDSLKLELKGKKEVTLEYGEEYKEKGYTAKFNKKDLTKKVKVENKIKDELGEYKIIYKIKYKIFTKKIVRKVKVVDTTAPTITLTDETINLVVGNEYEEPGFEVTDNYDKDLKDKVEIENKVDINNVGTYEVIYKVEDSSHNKTEVKRTVNVIVRNMNQKVAVLNYHFFYDSSKGEVETDGNFRDIVDFRKDLDYLKNNNYKTLTMQEFKDWMYGKIEIPEHSVLITIDDGAKGTGAHNGNKLIPILEEYKMHATLFLITGWWGIENYQSEYLDVESHTFDMHTERVCEGVARGAKMLCLSHDKVVEDLKKSREITGSDLAFCFPFFVYTDDAINAVKEAGFKLAFIGGGRKASRNDDYYKIPRYQIKKNTSLETFISYVS